MFDNRNYLIFNVNELHRVDFNQVIESSAETVRKSANGTKTFIKWEDDTPTFLSSLESAEGPYTYEEILQILSTVEWQIYINKLV